jgi:hypothetical protein
MGLFLQNKNLFMLSLAIPLMGKKCANIKNKTILLFLISSLRAYK